MSERHLLLGHSPDPDDAFMFYGLAAGKVVCPGWHFEHVMQDIQTLNERAVRGDLHVTAISIHAYPLVARQYALTSCGSSMGDGYGPLLVSRRPMTVEDLIGQMIAVPGELTTAFLVLNLMLGRNRFQHQVVRFDQILESVANGQADSGLIIHEGQLTYARQNLHSVVDLGQWWYEQTRLPLPLGGNCIRRDLGSAAMNEIATILRSSIEYGLAHRSEAVEYALQYARDLDRSLADKFIGLYVNDRTIDCGDTGRRAIRELLQRAYQIGMVSDPGPIDFIG
ncbi:MAG: menaquinone biosynthesis family protein [Planctomycetota bacterium]|jgi:1,4-dihydroxy-6-naphthoate synthase